MPHLPDTYGSFPLILRDYRASNPKRGELLFNYDSNELYFAKGSTGEVVSVARDIYDKILNSRIKNNKIVVFDADKLVPRPNKDDIVPPVRERTYNGIYYIVISRRDYGAGSDNPLTAPVWAVLQGKTFLGKASGYNAELDEGGN